MEEKENIFKKHTDPSLNIKMKLLTKKIKSKLDDKLLHYYVVVRLILLILYFSCNFLYSTISLTLLESMERHIKVVLDWP